MILQLWLQQEYGTLTLAIIEAPTVAGVNAGHLPAGKCWTSLGRPRRDHIFVRGSAYKKDVRHAVYHWQKNTYARVSLPKKT